MIPAFWYLSNNFGDALTPYLIRKISGKMPVWVEPTSDIPKVLVTGSILNVDAVNATIWGCGIANSDDELPVRDIRCVRGNLTLDRYISQRIKYKEDLEHTENVAVGDPCLLLPTYFNPEVTKKYKIGIIPHYIEAYYLFNNIPNIKEYSDILVLDVNKDVEEFIKDLLSCEIIMSSSLHGIICADAYNIPSCHVQFTDKIGGDGFKYVDWFSNFHDRDYRLNDFRGDIDIHRIYDVADKNTKSWRDNLAISVNNIFDSCPFKN